MTPLGHFFFWHRQLAGPCPSVSLDAPWSAIVASNPFTTPHKKIPLTPQSTPPKQTRELWYEQQHALAYVLALLQDKNSEIRRMAGLILDVVVRYWPEHKPKVREIKFKARP